MNHPHIVEMIDEIAVLRLDATGFDELDLPQRLAVYHFARAARVGDRITFDQWNRFHLPMLQLLEGIVLASPSLPGDLLERVTLFLKKVWLHRGNHDMDSTQKMLPPFNATELHLAARAAAQHDVALGVPHAERLETWIRSLEPAFFDERFHAQLTCKDPPAGMDVVTASAVNFYQDVTEAEVLSFQGKHALNATLIKENGRILEDVWRAGGSGVAPGRYAAPLRAIIGELEAAFPYLPTDQIGYLQELVHYFRTGDPEAFRNYNRRWVRVEPQVDVIVGFLEQYRDPLGHRGEYEGSVHLTDRRQITLMQTLSQHAAYFESRMPWDPAWSRTELGSTVANVSNLITLAGSAAPFGYSGVNLPNESRLREEAGSKSLLIGNIVRQRQTVYGDAYLREFSPDSACLERARKHAGQARELTIALHEVIGHASGRISEELEGEPELHLREFYSTLEEARADLVALWHLFDPKLVELKLAASPAVAEEGLWDMVRHAMITIARLQEPVAEEDHDRAELMVIQFLMDIKAGIAAITRDGKTYWVVKDPREMRRGVGTLLAEIMRIKATGDYHAIRALVQRYGTKVKPELHRELRGRALELGVPDKIAFLNPVFELKRTSSGEISDVVLRYPESFLHEQLALSHLYRSF